MRYFLPDSQDLVDPSFDFQTEQRARTRLRQRDDLYAHEIFCEPAFDGLLVSKGIVDGFGASGGRYTLAQRQRLLRSGAEAFFRLRRAEGSRIPVMGDCGAFTYVKEEKPPYSVQDVIAFYVDCGFEYGLSVDHMILAQHTMKARLAGDVDTFIGQCRDDPRRRCLGKARFVGYRDDPGLFGLAQTAGRALPLFDQLPRNTHQSDVVKPAADFQNLPLVRGQLRGQRFVQQPGPQAAALPAEDE